jgi:hypothetical protein
MILGVLLFLFLVEVHSQDDTPYILFQGKILPNNSYVEFYDVWYSYYQVQCRTQLRNCCTTTLGELGDWFFPNGSRLLFRQSNNDIYQSRGIQRVNLHRKRGTSPTGIYCCHIPYKFSAKERLCVGLYNSYRGSNIALGAVNLAVDSDLNGASPRFTLSCISTGGPATTVTWTRDSITVTEGNIITVLDDTTTAQYTHTLTVTGRMPGLYNCTVENTKPSSDSRIFSINGIAQP